jgi:predicted unusual protein kinase regulating ubiquinone biosynthesis (AarF/ABC1/UbiB family)
MSELESELEPDGPGRPEHRLARSRPARAAPLVALTARTAGEAALLGARGGMTGDDAAAFHTRTAQRYAELLGHSKGALMKAGQMLSFSEVNPAVREDFQPIYRQALARLREGAPPMAPGLARSVLERELGRSTDEVFAEFDFEPLAAASIGQVHAARLHDGREVAVKLQYPDVAQAIAADLANAELLSTFVSLAIGFLSPRRVRFDLHGMAREMGVRIAEELDYRVEAANQMEFAANYRGHPFIHIPEVVPELCAERVLTQELVRGRNWSSAVAADQQLRDRWAEAIWRFTYGSNVRFCLLNVDPHPGNYLFHDDGSVSFLDFGCVKRFRREQTQVLGAIGNECLKGNVTGTWRASVEGGFWRSSDPVTPQQVYEYWRGALEMYWGEQPFTVTPERAARSIGNMMAPRGPAGHAFRYSTASPEYTVMTRVNVGAISLVGRLRASGYWDSIGAELYQGAQPLTEMGRREHRFFEEGERLPISCPQV